MVNHNNTHDRFPVDMVEQMFDPNSKYECIAIFDATSDLAQLSFYLFTWLGLFLTETTKLSLRQSWSRRAKSSEDWHMYRCYSSSCNHIKIFITV